MGKEPFLVIQHAINAQEEMTNDSIIQHQSTTHSSISSVAEIETIPLDDSDSYDYYKVQPHRYNPGSSSSFSSTNTFLIDNICGDEGSKENDEKEHEKESMDLISDDENTLAWGGN